jgi:hypothetical protein
MVLHLPHADSGFGVTFTKDAAFYTTTSRFVAWLGAFSQERQKLWLPKDDLQDSASWSSPPLVLLRDIHNSLLANYDCKDTAPPQSQPGTGDGVARSQQDGDAQQQETGPLLIPQLNRLHEAYFVRGEDAPMLPPCQLRIGLHTRSLACENTLKISDVNLESQEEDSPRRVLGFKYMSWLGQIQSHHRDEVWSTSL